MSDKVKSSDKSVLNLTYPVNVARNVAREAANTHFIFPSDVELYPSPGTACSTSNRTKT